MWAALIPMIMSLLSSNQGAQGSGVQSATPGTPFAEQSGSGMPGAATSTTSGKFGEIGNNLFGQGRTGPFGLPELGAALGGFVTDLIQGKPDQSAYKAQRDQLRTQQEYQKASIDPTHPWNVGLTNQLQAKMQQDAAHSVFTNLIEQQRAKARGYTGATNASRQDEATSGSLMKAFMNAGVTARAEASKRLAAAAGNPDAVAAHLGDYANQNLAQQYANNQTQTNQVMSTPYLANGLWNALSGMFGGSGTEAQVNNSTDTAFQQSPWLIGTTPYSGAA